MRKLILIVVGAVLGIVAVEALSSYVLYRYFALAYKEFRPSGSAAYQLLERMIVKAQGGYMTVKVSSDRLPLFSADDELGYVLDPGEFNIIEAYDHLKHTFHLQVTPDRRRATSYLPVHASHRLFFTGDSAVFGWGLNDEETIPWLLQSHLPNDEVINLSLTSYSAVHTLLQLKRVSPQLGADDAVVLMYHPLTNDFDVAATGMLKGLSVGYELQLGDAKALKAIKVPFGALDANGNLDIRRIELSCATPGASPACARPAVDAQQAMHVTERVFDEILALHAGRVVVALISGRDDDPVIGYLRSKGVKIADLRVSDDEPDAHDIMVTDNHSGAFQQYLLFQRLLAFLRAENMVHADVLAR